MKLLRLLAYTILFNVHMSISALQEKPFVVLICAYNAEPWVKRNLDSIFKQSYSNFRLIYVDDHSSDNTVSLVKKYIASHKLEEKVTLICNSQQVLKLDNLYKAVHSCKDKEIILQVDYDDWLAHKNVLKEINQVYSKNNVWLTYGQFREYPSGNIGYSKRTPSFMINNLEFRNSWHYMHPKTFYAWLFKLIKKEDLLAQNVAGFEGKYYPYSNDLATIYPMLEMAKNHIYFIPKIAYIRNTTNPISWYNVPKKRITSAQCSDEIRNREKYQPLPDDYYDSRLN